jgi:hypothetical protein
MWTLVLTYWSIISMVFVLGLIAVPFFIPGWAGLLTSIVFIFSIVMVILFVVYRQREYQKSRVINRALFVRNVFIEIAGILLAMILACLLGRYIAQIATEQISDDLIKQIAGITIGLLTGIVVGIIVKRAWEGLVT